MIKLLISKLGRKLAIKNKENIQRNIYLFSMVRGFGVLGDEIKKTEKLLAMAKNQTDGLSQSQDSADDETKSNKYEINGKKKKK